MKPVIFDKLKHVDDLLLYPDFLARKIKSFNESYIVASNGCWNWTKSLTSEGRAASAVGRFYTNAARISYVIYKLKPVGDLSVCHSCDNILCINPDHLWLGSTSDNIKDMYAKKRHSNRKGENSYVAKLTDKQVSEIRELHKEGLTSTRIAFIYGVSVAQISRILNNKSRCN